MEEENDNIFTDEDKPKIVGLIKKFIKGNGYISVRFACQEYYKDKYKLPEIKRWKTDAHQAAFINSVSYITMKTGKYSRADNRNDLDYDIYKNPAFLLNKSVRFISIVSVIISCLSVGVAYLSYKKSNKTSQQQLQTIETRKQLIQMLQHNLEPIRFELRRIADSLSEK